MWISQSYARPSVATLEADGLRFEMAAEQHRPPVSLQATVLESAAYARVMLALFEVVRSDLRFKPKDHAAYQAWVQQRYLDELGPELEARRQKLPGQTRRRQELGEQLSILQHKAQEQRNILDNNGLRGAIRRYWKWLAGHNMALWIILDPVVSVHPDGVIFEVFSQDESSYGRVTVPMENLDLYGEALYGTTNVDFSQELANEIHRVRPYRPAQLGVGGSGVSIATTAGSAFEKKIDLPPSWVRGFLQVQSAGTLPGVDVKLSAATMAEVLLALRLQREKQGPRSLRFVLAPGERPRIVIEPWGTEIVEAELEFLGEFYGEIRIWGRRRLLALEGLLPHTGQVRVKLLGTGMPSFWTVEQNGHRLDVGLSGWTQNDWSRAARFDLLASTATVSSGDIELAAGQLETRLRLSPAELADHSDLSREAATSALQQLCREGRAMYDMVTGVYRWRQLLPPDVMAVAGPPDPRLDYARRLVAAGAVKWLKLKPEDSEFRRPEENTTRLRAQVSGIKPTGETRGERKFDVTLDLDPDGRASFAQCTCSEFRRNKLRQGPCAHILAVSALAPQQVAQIRAAGRETTGGASSAAAAPPLGGSVGVAPDRFKGQTFVFTGTLVHYSRDQAESLVQQGGGKAAGGVSRNTTCLVAGEKAGSKLLKARLLGVRVISEDDFKNMVEGKEVD